MQLKQQRQIRAKVGDIHRQWVILDFASEWVTRLNCECHPLNVSDLADLW